MAMVRLGWRTDRAGLREDAERAGVKSQEEALPKKVSSAGRRGERSGIAERGWLGYDHTGGMKCLASNG